MRPLTVVDFGDAEGRPRDRRRFRVEAFEPVPHGRLGIAVVPEDVQHGCLAIVSFWERVMG